MYVAADRMLLHVSRLTAVDTPLKLMLPHPDNAVIGEPAQVTVEVISEDAMGGGAITGGRKLNKDRSSLL